MIIPITLKLPLSLALDICHLADEEALDVSQWIVKYLSRRIDRGTGRLKEDSRNGVNRK